MQHILSFERVHSVFSFQNDSQLNHVDLFLSVSGMGKKPRDRRATRLAELQTAFKGRIEPEIIEMVLEDAKYDIDAARKQLEALAPPSAAAPAPTPVDLRASSGSQISANSEETTNSEDRFDPLDADPIFATLRREFPEDQLDSAVLQLILDESRKKTIESIRERLVILTGYNPALAPKKPSKKRPFSRSLSRSFHFPHS